MMVTGLGQCALDHIFIVDSFPERDTKKEVTEWTVCSGGPVATALVSLSRLGVNCSFYGITGDDESGKKIRASLDSEGVNIRELIERPDSNSQVAFIMVEKGSGKRTILWKRPSGEPLKPAEVPDSFLDKTEFLLLDGLMADASIYAAREAQKKNIPVMLDAGRIREGMLELASICDYVVASEDFGRDLIEKYALSNDPSDFEKALLHIKSLGAGTCTITLGEKGSMTFANDEVFHTPAFKVNTVDTTGAGDVFHGGYIYGLLQKQDIRNVVRFASAFAALKCRKPGGQAGIPTSEEVNVLLEKNTL